MAGIWVFSNLCTFRVALMLQVHLHGYIQCIPQLLPQTTPICPSLSLCWLKSPFSHLDQSECHPSLRAGGETLMWTSERRSPRPLVIPWHSTTSPGHQFWEPTTLAGQHWLRNLCPTLQDLGTIPPQAARWSDSVCEGVESGKVDLRSRVENTTERKPRGWAPPAEQERHCLRLVSIEPASKQKWKTPQGCSQQKSKQWQNLGVNSWLSQQLNVKESKKDE